MYSKLIELSTSIYGLRQWKNTKFLLFSIVLGFSFFIALLTVSLQIFPSVYSTLPNWVKLQNQHYLTLGRKNAQNELVPISGHQINKLRGVQQINSVATIGFRSVAFDLNNGDKRKLNTAYVDKEFSSISQLALSSSQLTDTTAFVSKVLWQQLPINDAQERHLIQVNTGTTYKVVGYFPKSLEKIGKEYPDIILNKSQLIHTLPIRINPNTSAAARKRFDDILNSFPIYFAILRSENSLNKDALQSILNKAQASTSSIEFRELPAVPWFINGVEFSPNLRASITEQCIFVLALIFILGFICFFNTFSSHSAMAIKRTTELQMRLVVGAQSKQIAFQMVVEQVPKLLCILITSYLLYGWIITVTNSHPIYQQYFQDNLYTDMKLWLITSVTCCLLIVLCALIPSVKAINTTLFNRNNMNHGDKKHSRISAILTTLQIGFAIVSLTFSIELVSQSFKHKMHYQYPENLQEYSVTLDRKLALHTINSALQKVTSDLSWSDQSFIGNSPLIAEVSPTKRPEINIQARIKFVSDNYFKNIDATYLSAPSELRGVVINAEAAKLLKNTDITESINIVALLNSDSLPIAGVVNDLPHMGNQHASQPVIYIPFDLGTTSPTNRVTLYSKNNSDTLKKQLTMALDKYAQIKKLSLQPAIEIQLREANIIQITLLNFSILMATIVLPLLFCSFYFQSIENFENERIRFGVMRAVGATKFMTGRYLLLKNSKLFIVSSLLTVSIFYALDQGEINMLNINQFAIISVIGAITTSYLVVCAAIVICNFQSRTSIAQQLK